MHDPSTGRAPALVLVMALATLLSGCVTSVKYRLARHATPPQPVELRSATGPLAVDLAAVIVFKGPGSWKEQARWDEYLVRLVNSGAEPLVVDSAELIDVRGTARAPGEEPWALEKLSRDSWEEYRRAGYRLALGAGGAALYIGAVTSVTNAAWLFSSAAATNLVLVVGVIPLVAVADITTVAVMNHDNRRAVEREFQRRRLILPRTLAAAETASGSLFFPMTPGPQRLLLHAQRAGEPILVTLELDSLGSLHLDAAK